jgi:hypothetical protein
MEIMKDFNQIKKGDLFSLSRTSGDVTLIANGKARSCGKRGMQRLSLSNIDNLSGCKYWLYNRDNNVSLAFGDMGITYLNIESI